MQEFADHIDETWINELLVHQRSVMHIRKFSPRQVKVRIFSRHGHGPLPEPPHSIHDRISLCVGRWWPRRSIDPHTGGRLRSCQCTLLASATLHCRGPPQRPLVSSCGVIPGCFNHGATQTPINCLTTIVCTFLTPKS